MKANLSAAVRPCLSSLPITKEEFADALFPILQQHYRQYRDHYTLRVDPDDDNSVASPHGDHPLTLPGEDGIGLAVSGGVDSMALSYLLANHIRHYHQPDPFTTFAQSTRGPSQTPLHPPFPRLHAYIVDHRLRPESRDEAKKVAAELSRLHHRLQEPSRNHNQIPYVTPFILPLDWAKELPWMEDELALAGDGKPGELPVAPDAEAIRDFLPKKSNMESLARKARYRILGQSARKHGVSKLFVAHHEDDQHETVLMRLLGGAKSRGLVGMRPQNPLPECYHTHGIYLSGSYEDEIVSHPPGKPSRCGLPRNPQNMTPALQAATVKADMKIPQLPMEYGGVFLFRPLLSFGKDRLRATCEANKIPWFEDPTNTDVKLTRRNALRSLIRREAMPTALGKPAIMALARQCIEDAEQQEAMVERIWREHVFRDFNMKPRECSYISLATGTASLNLPSFTVIARFVYDDPSIGYIDDLLDQQVRELEAYTEAVLPTVDENGRPRSKKYLLKTGKKLRKSQLAELIHKIQPQVEERLRRAQEKWSQDPKVRAIAALLLRRAIALVTPLTPNVPELADLNPLLGNVFQEPEICTALPPGMSIGGVHLESSLWGRKATQAERKRIKWQFTREGYVLSQPFPRIEIDVKDLPVREAFFKFSRDKKSLPVRFSSKSAPEAQVRGGGQRQANNNNNNNNNVTRDTFTGHFRDAVDVPDEKPRLSLDMSLSTNADLSSGKLHPRLGRKIEQEEGWTLYDGRFWFSFGQKAHPEPPPATRSYAGRKNKDRSSAPPSTLAANLSRQKFIVAPLHHPVDSKTLEQYLRAHQPRLYRDYQAVLKEMLPNKTRYTLPALYVYDAPADQVTGKSQGVKSHVTKNHVEYINFTDDSTDEKIDTAAVRPDSTSSANLSTESIDPMEMTKSGQLKRKSNYHLRKEQEALWRRDKEADAATAKQALWERTQHMGALDWQRMSLVGLPTLGIFLPDATWWLDCHVRYKNIPI